MCELNLTHLTYGGDAMGRLDDGRAVFVPYGLPGERVRVMLVEEKRGHARGQLLEVLQAAPERIAARCPHFGVCGGCHYQHLSYEHQLQAKHAILIEQLQRLAGLANPPVRPMVAAPQPWGYRNTVQFHLSPEGKLGYQAAGSHQVVAIGECHLPETALNETWPLLDFEAMPELERVSLRLGRDDQILLVLEGSDPQPPEFSVDITLSAAYVGPAEAAGLAAPVVLAGDEALVLEVLGRPFQVSAGSFFQVNTAQAGAMVQHVQQLLPCTPQTTFLDVYCGVGLFSAFFAGQVGRLIGVELSPSACDDFVVNLDEFENVELYQGRAEEVLPGLQVQPDVVLVDPPRSGLDRAALQTLAALHPPLLAYVSCDPATLARDARHLLSAGYQLQQVTPFDLFPQTFHIESVSLFTS